MREHYFFKIEWIDFPNKTNRRVSGCYLIGDCYVGASEHIRSRILFHCAKVFSTVENKFNNHRESSPVYDYIEKCLRNNNPISVKLISKNPNDEKLMFEKYNIAYSSRTRFYNQTYKK